MAKVPDSVPEDERIWFSLAAYNMGWGHMLDARKLTKTQKGNPDSWVDVKQRLPMLSQKRYYPQLTYGYARGREAYNYVENIRRYRVSPVGYLQEREKGGASGRRAGGVGERLPDGDAGTGAQLLIIPAYPPPAAPA